MTTRQPQPTAYIPFETAAERAKPEPIKRNADLFKLVELQIRNLAYFTGVVPSWGPNYDQLTCFRGERRNNFHKVIVDFGHNDDNIVVRRPIDLASDNVHAVGMSIQCADKTNEQIAFMIVSKICEMNGIQPKASVPEAPRA